MAKKSPLSAAETFRRNVRRVMDAHGLTISALAVRAGTSRPGMSRILSGIDNVTLLRAERIAKALHVTVYELLQKNVDKFVKSA